MRGYFVTSTGTDIGKTYITAAVIREALTRGRKVRAIKPLISGFDEGSAATSDTANIIQALGRPFDQAQIDSISPWRYKQALSPDMAARREETSVDYPGLLQFCRECAQGPEDLLLIEGVGGAFVPLDEKHVVADWIGALGLPSLLVVGSYLGTISHTLATARAMRRHGLVIAAIVVTESETSPVPIDETAETIRRFLPDLPLVTVPRGSGVGELVDLLRVN